MPLNKFTYSVPNLKTLVSSSNSCVYCIENCSRSLVVLAVHLSNIKRSVNQLLSDKVTTYDAVLKGIILGHKKIKVINHVQLNDNGNFSLDYVADIYVFKPEVGNLLSGEVNKKSKDHIGVLVHSFFNVSIPRPRNDTECPKNWIGFDVNIGQSVTFEVVKVNFSGRLPFIKGKLIDLCEIDFEDRDSGIGGHESMEENTIMNDKSKIEVVRKKKKKKKRKSEDQVYGDNDLEEQDSADKNKEVITSEELVDTLIKEADDELNNCSPEKKKKKKKKKSEGHVYDDNDLQEQNSVDRSEEVITSEELIDTLIKEADDELNNCSPEKKKKKKKKKSEGHVYDDNDLQEQDSVDRSEEVITSEELIDTLIKEVDEELNNCSPGKKKKKKKNKFSSVEEDLKVPLGETSKSKKRKFSESDSFQGTKPNFSLNSDELDEINIPKKKKRKKHSDSNI